MYGIPVHQTCYGVPELPGVDDMWHCRACELKVSMRGITSLEHRRLVVFYSCWHQAHSGLAH